MINYFVYGNFDFSYAAVLQDAQETFLWTKPNELENETDGRNIFNFALVLLRLTAECVRNLRDLYIEYQFVSVILTLWLIGQDFKTCVRENLLKLQIGIISRSNKVITRGNLQLVVKVIKENLQHYRKIVKLCNEFSTAYGIALFAYFLMSVTYYSASLDKIYLPIKIGAKVYFILFICTAGIIYGCGAHFALEVLYINTFMYYYTIIIIHTIIIVVSTHNFRLNIILFFRWNHLLNK